MAIWSQDITIYHAPVHCNDEAVLTKWVAAECGRRLLRGQRSSVCWLRSSLCIPHDMEPLDQQRQSRRERGTTGGSGGGSGAVPLSRGSRGFRTFRTHTLFVLGVVGLMATQDASAACCQQLIAFDGSVGWNFSKFVSGIYGRCGTLLAVSLAPVRC